ncbi:hypothetical protein [Dactylosporangium sp. CA-233914]|uniref:hypothetical protein n=1 Tax=Dactylosporangium sp. CA-233914 TaxID=3239934 RepID=UPI003D94A99E
MAVCLGGGLTFYVAYDKATTPERGTPAVSLQQYITAKFSIRDKTRAKLFTCGDANLSQVDDLLGTIESRESETGVGIQVTLRDLSVVESSNSATINTNLDVGAAQGNGTTVVSQRWEFGLRDVNGWRVCSATRLS